MALDPKLVAARLLTEAVIEYLGAAKALADASDRTAMASTGKDAAARRSAYQALTELGTGMRLAERRLIHTARKVRNILAATDIEDVARKLDKRDSPESAWVIVKAALSG